MRTTVGSRTLEGTTVETKDFLPIDRKNAEHVATLVEVVEGARDYLVTYEGGGYPEVAVDALKDWTEAHVGPVDKQHRGSWVYELARELMGLGLEKFGPIHKSAYNFWLYYTKDENPDEHFHVYVADDGTFSFYPARRGTHAPANLAHPVARKALKAIIRVIETVKIEDIEIEPTELD